MRTGRTRTATRVIWRTALFLLVFINAGCHSKAGLKDSGPDTVTYIAHDESFAGPTNIAAGHITVRLVNEGEDPHHIQFIKLLHGKTADDLIAAIKAASSVTPVWARYAGGPNAVVGNETSEATIDLRGRRVCSGVPGAGPARKAALRTWNDQACSRHKRTARARRTHQRLG